MAEKVVWNMEREELLENEMMLETEEEMRSQNEMEHAPQTMEHPPVPSASIEKGKPVGTETSPHMEFMMSVPLPVTVEIGRAKRKIRDILEFKTGTILPLDKLAGDPVDILVNGTCIATGEVVVIDDYFGVRITSIHPDRLCQP